MTILSAAWPSLSDSYDSSPLSTTYRLSNVRTKTKVMAGQPPEPRSTARGVYHLFLGNVTATSLMAVGSIVVALLMYVLFTRALRKAAPKC